MWSRKDLKTKAKLLVKVNYWWMVLISLILLFVGGSGSGSSSSSSAASRSKNSSYVNNLSDFEVALILSALAAMLLIVLFVLVIAFLLKAFLLNPLLVGCRRYILNMREGKRNFNDVVFVFSNSYMNVVKIMFLRDLKTFLWSLLLIIPGIVKSYEYSMIPYILTENPEIDSKRAFELTRSMTYGDKWHMFVLDLSFILWILAALFTCLLAGIFWVYPYINATMAELYIELRQKVLNGGDARTGELCNYNYIGVYTNAN